MKRLLFYPTLLMLLLLCTASKPVSKDCKCNDIPLYGRVKFVEHHADFRVRQVEHHADLHVRIVKDHPNSCGLWRVVEDHPDFTVQWVEHHEDFSVRVVEHHPGVQ